MGEEQLFDWSSQLHYPPRLAYAIFRVSAFFCYSLGKCAFNKFEFEF